MKQPAKKKAPNVARKIRRTAAGHGKRAKTKGAPTPPVRGWSLSTLPAVRRRLAQIVTDLSRGGRFKSALGLSRARCLIYGLDSIAGILKAEAETRIEEKFGEIEEKILAMKGTS